MLLGVAWKAHAPFVIYRNQNSCETCTLQVRVHITTLASFVELQTLQTAPFGLKEALSQMAHK